MRRVFLLISLLLLTVAATAPAEIIDRIAAIIEDQVITTSEIDQMVLLQIIPRNSGESMDDYRHRLLLWMIAQTLRYRDVQRFGSEDVSKDAIEARLQEIVARFPSPEAFQQAVSKAELSMDEIRALVKRQLQVEAYVEERFSPMIFVPLEEVEQYYREVWLPQRRDRGLPPQPLSEVRPEIRALLKSERLQQEIDRWTEELRSRANVDVYTW